jgi:hypothetical protein
LRFGQGNASVFVSFKHQIKSRLGFAQRFFARFAERGKTGEFLTDGDEGFIFVAPLRKTRIWTKILKDLTRGGEISDESKSLCNLKAGRA